jgi:DDE superfamily endonuclease
MDDQLLDLYTDYLISSFGLVTATGLSTLLGGSVSHDKITRFLASPPHTTADLWRIVKPFVRQMQSADGVMIMDDSIAEKPASDENDIVCWHYDHAQDRMVKGINFVSCLYHAQEISLPVGFALIAKTETYIDKKDGKQKRRSPVTKNEIYQTLLRHTVQNQIPFRYVLNDVWYSSADNMKFVKHSLKKDFIMPLKANRKVALGLAAKLHGQFVRLDALPLEPHTRLEVYLEGVDFPLYLVKQIFANKDGSTGVQYLVTSDAQLTVDEITTLYQKRWNVEPYHKSLKQNAGLEKSPTHTVTTQTNHLFATLCAFIKLEMLKTSTQLNHFALRAKLYLRALEVAYATLGTLKPVRLAA